ncbi:hypothetical protein ACL6C3_07480 [Capilliphycus salinus ALCB114379]|uniref:hypothetical protein n=1 Tax=Capilliphycus salinus TaxID=2768948 RepID=UPI0039A66E4A
MDSSTPFIRSGLASLRQPAAIAAIASVGIHALFAVNIEKIPLFPNTAQLPPSVELVELSADQVGGIYPPPQPKYGLSQIPVPSSILGGPTLPSFPSNAPPPPSPTFSSPQPEFFTIPVDPSVASRGSGLPSYPQSSYPETSESYSDESYPDESYSFSTFPIPPNFPINTPPAPSPSQQGGGFTDRKTQELDNLRTREELLGGQEIPWSQDPEQLSASGVLDPESKYDNQQENKPPAVSARKGLNDQLASGNPNQESSQPSSPLILRRLQEGLGQEENTDVAANSPGNGPTFELEPEQGPQGQVSDQQARRIEGGSLYVSWVSGLQESYPDIQTDSPISISDVYPIEACEQQLSGQALVGVVVGSGGEILAGPELLLDTGYPVLDNEAVQRVREFAASEGSGGGGPTAYQYSFSFNSENCGGQPSSTDQMPPQVIPGDPQPAEDNSTSEVTESEDNGEDPVIPTSDDGLQTPPDTEVPVTPEAETMDESSEEGLQTPPDTEVPVTPEAETMDESSQEGLQTPPDTEVPVTPEAETMDESSEEGLQTPPDTEVPVTPEAETMDESSQEALETPPDTEVPVTPEAETMDESSQEALETPPDTEVPVTPEAETME